MERVMEKPCGSLLGKETKMEILLRLNLYPMPDLSILIGELPDTDELTSSGMLEIRLGMEVNFT